MPCIANHDYEPDARARDAAVERSLRDLGIAFLTSKDQVIFERDEVLSQAGKPFAVFTPYKNAWLAALTPFFLRAVSRRTPRRSARPTAARDRRQAADAGGPRVRADELACAADRHRHERRREAVRRFPEAHRRLREDARLSRAQGAVVPFGAPALRNGVDQGARGVRP